MIYILKISRLTWCFLITGCVFSTPFKGAGFDDDSGQILIPHDERVVVAITNAIVDRSTRGTFDSKTREIVRSIDDYEGYIAGSFRFEILGDEVWTLSVWRDREALEKFVNSRQHLDAMYSGSSAVKLMRSVVVDMPAAALPIDWDTGEKLLEAETLKPLPLND